MSRRSFARPARALVALAAGVAAVALLCGLRAPGAADGRGAIASAAVHDARAAARPCIDREDERELPRAGTPESSAGAPAAAGRPVTGWGEADDSHPASTRAGASTPGPAEHLQALMDALRAARARGDRMLARHLEERLAAAWAEDGGIRTAWLRALVEERDPDRAEALLDLTESWSDRAAPGDAAADSRAFAEGNAALHELLESGAPSRVRQRAISLYRWSAEAGADDAWTASLSRTAVADPDPEVQTRAIRVLAARVPGEAVTASIGALVSGHPDPTVRGAAAAALAHRILPRARPEATLVALADDPAPWVRRAACEALESALLRPSREDVGRVPPVVAREVIAAIGDRLEAEPDAGVRCVLVRTLFVAGGAAALPWLEAHAEEGDPDPELHRAMGAALDASLGALAETTARRAALEEVAPDLFVDRR